MRTTSRSSAARNGDPDRRAPGATARPAEDASLSAAVLTVSDTRDKDSDTSGDYLVQALESAGHAVSERALVPDDVYRIRAALSAWIADPAVHVALITGGTGFSSRDSTPEAVAPLLDKPIPGFGELFRQLSWDDIGSSTVQSRAFAGLANRTAIFCMPGSTGACRLAWEKILSEQLDARHRPCNFAAALIAPRGAVHPPRWPS